MLHVKKKKIPSNVLQTARLYEGTRHSCWFQCVGFNGLSTVTRVFFSHMTNVEPAFPLRPHSGVEVIQFLQRTSWTALKSVVKDFGANIGPTKYQCGSDFRSYGDQKHFKFEVKLLETPYFVMDFIFFFFSSFPWTIQNNIIVRKLYGKIYSSQPLIWIAWLDWRHRLAHKLNFAGTWQQGQCLVQLHLIDDLI